MRAELMMTIMPRRINRDGMEQTAFVLPVFKRMCYRSIIQQEGLFLMNSVTSLLDMLPWKVAPVLHSFHHPFLTSKEMDFFSSGTYSGNLHDALEEGYLLTCDIHSDSQSDSVNHCVLLVDYDDERMLVFKNSSLERPILKKSIDSRAHFLLSDETKVSLPDPCEGFCIEFVLVDK